MGADDGPAAGSLIGLLEREAFRFDFYQAVRLVELLRPGKIPVGHGGSNDEPVVFRSKVGLDFPASDLVSAEFSGDESEPVRLTVAFMGLAGGSGPLPTPFTELIIQRTAARDYATRDFLDIFNHRLISFLYRSRKKHRLSLDNRPPETTNFARWLFDLSGLEFAAHDRDSRKWARSLLRYAGILTHQVRSMSALEAILSDYFRAPVHGEQLLGRWLVIAARDRTRIGRGSGANRRLGVDTVLGTRAWDQAGRIRLRISALNLARLREFLPGRRAFESLGRIARVHLQQDIDIDLRLSLDPGQVLGTRLGRKNDSRLGWTSWLSTGPSRSDYDPVRVRLPALRDRRPHQLIAAHPNGH